MTVGDWGDADGMFGERYAGCGRAANVDVAVSGRQPSPTGILPVVIAAVKRGSA